jgi:hypothetical protein
MKKIFFFCIAILLLLGNPKNSTAQDHEVGMVLGAAQYLGDLTYTHISWKNTKYNLGGIYRLYFNPYLNLRATILYGQIKGDDQTHADLTNYGSRRNLSFQSHILEFAAQAEYNILPFISGNRLRFWTPYLFAGVAVYNFNPKAELDGVLYALQPLGTSGQYLSGPEYEDPYKLTQVAIPYGFGLKFSFRRPSSSRGINLYLWNIGVFIQQNKLFTDMLDDVGGIYPDWSLMSDPIAIRLSDRQGYFDNSGNYVPVRGPGTNRGNPHSYDSYMWLGFNITKTLRRNTCFCF